MHDGVHPWMVMEVKATVTSMDTVTEGMHSGVHSWMVMDGHS